MRQTSGKRCVITMSSVSDDIKANRIKPIETRYKGYRFRSRLEARWAVFFDAFNVKWQYEPEGFDLGVVGYYLPDFFVSINWHKKYINPGYFVEIKGTMPEKTEFKKLKTLSKQTNHSCRMFIGVPGDQETFWCHKSGRCGWYNGIEHPESPGKWLLPPSIFALQCFTLNTENKEGVSISRAINAARSARFEYGERP